jgi:hypothetical protein
MKNAFKALPYLLLAFIIQSCNNEKDEIFESYNLKGNSQGSEILFTDEKFKDVLINTNCVDTNGDGIGDRNADENNDGEIQKKEANSIEALVLKFQYEIPIRFTSLQGIENFGNLKTLIMHGPGGYFFEEEILNNENLKIDLTSLRKLETLQINGIPTDYYEDLNLSGLNKLNKIDLSLNRPMNYEGDFSRHVMNVNLDGCSSLKEMNITNSFLIIDYCQVPSLERLNMEYLEGGEPDVFDFHCLSKLKWLNIAENMVDTLILKNSSVLDSFVYNTGYGDGWFYNPPNLICIDDIQEEYEQILPLVGENTVVTTNCNL